MAIVLPYVFGSLSGAIPASYLDANFNALATAMGDFIEGGITLEGTFSATNPFPGQGIFLDYTDNTQGGTGQTGESIGLYVDLFVATSPPNAWEGGYINTIYNGGAIQNIGTVGYNQPTPSGLYVRTQKLSAPVGITNVASSVAVGGSTTLFVNDVTNFYYNYANGIANPVSSSNPLLVIVNGNTYSEIACVSNSGKLYAPGYTGAVSETGVAAFTGPFGANGWNTDSYVHGGYLAGGYAGPGYLVFSSAVSAADGTAGNTVVARVFGQAAETVTFEARDTTGLKSSLAGPIVTSEFDISASGPDDASSRRIITMYWGFAGGSNNPYNSSTIQAAFDAAIFMDPSTNNVTMNRFIWMNGVYNIAALDLSGTSPLNSTVPFMLLPTGSLNNTSTLIASGTIINRYGYLTWTGQDVGTGYLGVGINTHGPQLIPATGTLQIAQMGSILVLNGSTAIAQTLIAANTIPSGLGFVFKSQNGQYLSQIKPQGSDTIQNLGTALNLMTGESVVLLSDGVSSWYSLGRTSDYGANGPSMTLAQLNVLISQNFFTTFDTGRPAFCSNALKSGETSGLGTGLPVFLNYASSTFSWRLESGATVAI